MNIDLTGRVALVTGAGRMRGTGHSIALALAGAGCDVVVHGSGSAPETWPESERETGWKGPESVADEIRAMGRRSMLAFAELKSSTQVDEMFRKVDDEFGRMDILVNNAAAPTGADRNPVTDLSDAEWHRVLGPKIHGAFYCSRAAAGRMRRQGDGGSIVNISSIGGKLGNATTAAYSVANAGMQMLGTVMARELGEDNIRVNSLCVGLVDTIRWGKASGSEQMKHFGSNVPLGRVATCEEIGEIVVFLCSPQASYITGQSLNIDGGWVVH